MDPILVKRKTNNPIMVKNPDINVPDLIDAGDIWENELKDHKENMLYNIFLIYFLK